MNQNALMAGSLLLMLSIVVLTPFFFAPETPVIFYETPSLVVDYINSSNEFRVYVYSTATNIRYHSVYINLTNLTNYETVTMVMNNTCAVYINTTWLFFKLNVTAVLDESSIFDVEIIVSLLLTGDFRRISIEHVKDRVTLEIREEELPFPILMERRW